MTCIRRLLSFVRKRVPRAWALADARRLVRRHGLRVPSGVWCCCYCDRVMWNLSAFIDHVSVHADWS
jgi:hypothetical protein